MAMKGKEMRFSSFGVYALELREQVKQRRVFGNNAWCFADHWMELDLRYCLAKALLKPELCVSHLTKRWWTS